MAPGATDRVAGQRAATARRVRFGYLFTGVRYLSSQSMTRGVLVAAYGPSASSDETAVVAALSYPD